LYNKPANKFVASFIGSPSMNFFDADLEDGVFRLGGATYDTGIRISQRVTIGLRPEGFVLSPGTNARICWFETLGAQSLLGLQIGEINLTALVRTRPAAETVDVGVDRDQIHVFDKDSGKNLGPAASHVPVGRKL
jgi:multiple sugar transport system ATP-binding protein